MNQSKKTYHHGDLRQSLLDSATQIIREAGVDGLSMRKLADRVGVSRTAPYHHFKDKNELLCAIAEVGFLQHDKVVGGTTEQPTGLDARARFEQYVMAYIHFADKNPETYDLMFGKEIWKRGHPTDSLQRVSKKTFRIWLEWVEEMQKQEVLTANHSALRTAQASWATLHGLCRLLNDGIYVNREDLEEMGHTVVDMMIRRP